jgi:hypothetical protein
MARQAFPDSLRSRIGIGLVAAIYPAAVTFTGLVLSENFFIAAASWLVYFAFFAPLDSVQRSRWVIGIVTTASVLSLTRVEGVAIAVIAVAVAAVLRKLPVALTAITLLAVLVAPGLLVIRNDVAIGRVELSDSIYRDANLLLSFDNGDPSNPLYRQGQALAYRGTSSAASRARFHSAISHFISNKLHDDAGSVIKFKAKGVGNFFFPPPVWNWAIEDFGHNYTLGDSVRHVDGRNVIRLAWSLVLAFQYVAALVGMRRWWRQRRRAFVAGMVVSPIVALALTIPFQADPRGWLLPSFLLIVPAGAGIAGASRVRAPITTPIEGVSVEA